MTPKPVFSNPQLAMLCVGATKEMVDHARVEMGPHAHCAVRIFMNDLASTAFETGRDYQVGSVIVKEKQILGYRTGASPGWQGSGRGIGGMIKRVKGYDESNGDWEYFYLEDPSSIESGKMESCIECHKKARASDFVFGAWHEDEND
ncbi:MAG: cytochrome P460 family protein [Planctomycetota bacterium]